PPVAIHFVSASVSSRISTVSAPAPGPSGAGTGFRRSDPCSVHFVHGVRTRRQALLACAALVCGALASSREAYAGEARVFAVDDGVRIRRGDLGVAAARGEGNAVYQPGGAVRLTAFRDEVVAFQIVVEAAEGEVAGATVELAPLAERHGAGRIDTID